MLAVARGARPRRARCVWRRRMDARRPRHV